MIESDWPWLLEVDYWKLCIQICCVILINCDSTSLLLPNKRLVAIISIHTRTLFFICLFYCFCILGQILQWTWRTCLPKCVPVKELPKVPLILLHRPLCSSQLVPPLSTPAQSVQRGRRELTVQSLTEMGFSESQAEMVYEAADKNRCKHDTPVLTVLFGLGLNPGSVLKVLEKCPELYSLKETQLQQRVMNLRKLGLLEGEQLLLLFTSLFYFILNVFHLWLFK